MCLTVNWFSGCGLRFGSSFFHACWRWNHKNSSDDVEEDKSEKTETRRRIGNNRLDIDIDIELKRKDGD